MPSSLSWVLLAYSLLCVPIAHSQPSHNLFSCPNQTETTGNSDYCAKAFPITNILESTDIGAMQRPLTGLGDNTIDYSIDEHSFFHPKQALHVPERSITQLQANQAWLTLTGRSYLRGPIRLSQPGRFILADEGYFYRDPTTGQISQIDLQGHVQLRAANMLLFSHKAHLQLTEHSGYLTGVLYRLLLARGSQSHSLSHAPPLVAWGQAARVEQIRPDYFHLWQATYTTCTPATPTWKLVAKELILDRASGRGQAYKTWLYYADIPVLYVSHLNFLLDDRRHSGFLFPVIGASTHNGISLSIPYYWNIAPNYDVLITPTWLSRQGLQLNGQLRYLTFSSRGQLKASYLFSNSRKPAVATVQNLLSWQDQTTWSPHWTSEVELHWTDDHYGLTDLADSPLWLANLVSQRANLQYHDNNWTFLARLNRYQTLHTIDQTPINPYNSLPALELNSETQQLYRMTYQVNNQLVYFQRSRNPGEGLVPPSALRLNSQLNLSWPITRVAGYVIPQLVFNMSYYRIGNQLAGYRHDIQRVLPQWSIDTGVYLDRDWTWRGRHYRQTLEPRLFYLYVPYRDQSHIPLFDSTLPPFSYDSLFTNNRFSGYDRIGDADQISVGISTRILEASDGNEKLRASLGQIYYFHDRRVNLCGPIDNKINSYAICAKSLPGAEVTSATTKLSPLAGQLNYQLAPHWEGSANVAWDRGNIITATLDIRYQPAPDRLFNINYSRIRWVDQVTGQSTTSMRIQNDLDRVGFSFDWPLSQHWSTVGGWSYALNRHYAPGAFYGLQYDSGCWAFRVVAARSLYQLAPAGNPRFNNTVYLQWQLKGLGAIGTRSIGNFLSNSIPGYQDNFGASI